MKIITINKSYLLFILIILSIYVSTNGFAAAELRVGLVPMGDVFFENCILTRMYKVSCPTVGARVRSITIVPYKDCAVLTAREVSYDENKLQKIF